jgi:hypothetical protein
MFPVLLRQLVVYVQHAAHHLDLAAARFFQFRPRGAMGVAMMAVAFKGFVVPGAGLPVK